MNFPLNLIEEHYINLQSSQKNVSNVQRHCWPSPLAELPTLRVHLPAYIHIYHLYKTIQQVLYHDEMMNNMKHERMLTSISTQKDKMVTQLLIHITPYEEKKEASYSPWDGFFNNRKIIT